MKFPEASSTQAEEFHHLGQTLVPTGEASGPAIVTPSVQESIQPEKRRDTLWLPVDIISLSQDLKSLGKERSYLVTNLSPSSSPDLKEVRWITKAEIMEEFCSQTVLHC